MLKKLTFNQGRVWKYGDNISTDHILPSRYMTQVEPHELASHCMAGSDPHFAEKVKSGDFLAAGDNIGYGSSREQAPQSLKYAGIKAVIAKSFARIFYRNCYNVGLPAIICPSFIEEVSDEDEIQLDLSQGLITNVTLNRVYTFTKPPAFLMEYICVGGLIPYLEKELSAKP